MKLKEETVKVVSGITSRGFDKVAKEHPETKEWKPIVEATMDCLLSLNNTNVLRLFAMLCICALDAHEYIPFEETFLTSIVGIRNLSVKNLELYEDVNSGKLTSDEFFEK